MKRSWNIEVNEDDSVSTIAMLILRSHVDGVERLFYPGRKFTLKRSPKVESFGQGVSGSEVVVESLTFPRFLMDPIEVKVIKTGQKFFVGPDDLEKVEPVQITSDHKLISSFFPPSEEEPGHGHCV